MSRAKLFACRTLEDEVNTSLNDTVECEFLEYGLHNTPAKLQQELQQKIDADSQHDLILLGYGLCSNGTAGLHSDRHTLIIPRVHDCISLLLGSREYYQQEFFKCPGTYYLSSGWIRQQGDPLSSYRRYCDKYGEAKARMFMELEYANYKRIAFIQTVGERQEDLEYSRSVAAFLGLEHTVLQGSTGYVQNLVDGKWDEEFLVIHPGKTVLLEDFM